MGCRSSGTCTPPGLQPSRSSAETVPATYSSAPASVTSQSHAFQKIVGARIDGSMFVTRSL